MVDIERIKKNRFKLDMAPLVDIVFLLLIFFMLTSTFLQQGMDISLPTAESSENQPNQNLTISINKDGSIELEKKRIKLKDLPLTIQKKLNEKISKTVVIQADKRVPFDHFAKVLDVVKLANVKDIAIATEFMNPSES